MIEAEGTVSWYIVIVYLLKSITTNRFAGSRRYIDLSSLVYIYEYMNDMGQVISVFIYVFSLYCHNITEIMLTVVLNINNTNP